MEKDIRDFTLNELARRFKDLGEPAHRAKQVFKWLHNKGCDDFSGMTNLPKTLIQDLKEQFPLNKIKCEEHLISKDGTEKFLWRLKDGECVESVLIKERKRRTLCMSTQVGCAFKCAFCASGMRGLVRDLQVNEILAQFHLAQKQEKERISNIVFMGMGEPLDNYDNLTKAISILNHPDGPGIGARKITISTCGLVPEIKKLSGFSVQIELSISLHAGNDKLRDELVPVNKKYPLGTLIKTCKEYSKKTGRIITLEYVLIRGKNDSLKNAEDVARIAKDLRAKVNLIPCNAFEGLKGEGAIIEQVIRFRDKLRNERVNVTIRKPKGTDILGACGQLAAEKTKR